MKVEQLLVQYLYNNKKVTLQDIGSFTISPDTIIATDNEKEAALPPGAISFDFNPKAPLDEELVDFIVQQTRKIRPLASSDLESYSILSKQFLNIGKPLIIEGLGTLQKSQQGMYEFMQGQTLNAKLEGAPSQVREKLSEEISFRSIEKKSSSAPKKGWLLVAGVLILGLIAAAIFYFMNKNKETKVAADQTYTSDTLVKTPSANTSVTDTIKKLRADTSLTVPVQSNDGYTFKVVIKEYNSKDAADKAFTKLTNYGHKLVLSKIDSVHYKIAIPFTTTLSDTTRARDSLSKFFQSKTYIDIR